MQIQNVQQTAAGTPQAKKIAKAGVLSAEDKKLKAACQDMEAVFLNMLLSEMRKSVPKDSLFGSSNADEIMKSMLDSELTKGMSKAGGIGLADMMYRQLSSNVNNVNTTQKGQAPS